MQVSSIKEHHPVGGRICQPTLCCQGPSQHLVRHQSGPTNPILPRTAAGAACLCCTAAAASVYSTVDAVLSKLLWMLCWACVVRQVDDGCDDGVAHTSLPLIITVKVQLVTWGNVTPKGIWVLGLQEGVGACSDTPARHTHNKGGNNSS